MVALKSKFKDYYTDIRKHIAVNDELLNAQEEKFKEQLDNWEITPEEQAAKLTEYYARQTETLLSSSISTTMQLLELEYKSELLNQQANQVIRQIQGYDDNLMVKMAEFQSGLASFAVNSGSDTAQDTIDRLNLLLIEIEKRIKVVLNNQAPVLGV